MLTDFKSKGRPRNGQWVWVSVGAERMLAIVDGPDHGHYRTRTSPLLKGEVEVVGWPSKAEMLAKPRAGRLGWYCLSVLEIGSRETAFHVLVDGERLTPVLDRKEFPAAVLATMAPDFAPRP